MIGCIIGAGGNTIRALQKELNVQMKIDKVDKSESDQEILTIRGVTSKVFPAKVKILELLADYLSNCEELVVPDDIIPMIVGKKGAKISQLREKYPDAIIDIENTTVKIQSANYETRQSIRDHLTDIIKTNYTNNAPISSDVAIAMKGVRGNDIRSLFGILNLQFDISPESGIIKFRGSQESVQKGMKAIEAFCESNQMIEMVCQEDDFSSIFNMGATDSTIKDIETKFNVEIRPNRKDLSVRIRGEKNAIEDAKKMIVAFLEGDGDCGSKVFTIDPQSFASVIGKGGITLKKFESDNNVRIDLLKTKGCVRVRGSVDCMSKAILEILKFVDEIKVNSTISVNVLSKDPIPETILQKTLELASSIFQIDISVDKLNIIFRGHLHLVDEAKQFVKEEFSGLSTFSLTVPFDLLPTIEKVEKELKIIESKNVGVKIAFVKNVAVRNKNSENLSLTINGNVKAVNSSKVAVARLLKHHLPLHFSVIELPSSCLKDMGAAFIHETYEKNQVSLTIDRSLKCVRFFGNEKSMGIVSEIIDAKFQEWKKHHGSLPIEDYMLPALIGKNGSAIIALQKELNIKIHLNRIAMLLEVESPSSSDTNTLEEALVALEEKISNLKVHSWETVIDVSLIGLLVGKQGEYSIQFN